MSKSKGNVISPATMIEKYGTDAVRLALIFSSAAGNDITLAEDRIRGMQHFANKLWNIARFVQTNTTLGNELLKIHRNYLKEVMHLMKKFELKGIAHITGGGLIDNPPRILPEGIGMKIYKKNMQTPWIF